MRSPATAPRIGVSWRKELDAAIAACSGVDLLEVMFEEVSELGYVTDTLRDFRDRGSVWVHGATLSLGGADWPEQARLDECARTADLLKAPRISEHIAFVRASNFEAWHLLPLPRTPSARDLFLDNMSRARKVLDRPIAVENIATLFNWPENVLSEPDFIASLVTEGDLELLLDLENVRIVSHNFGLDPLDFLARLPLERVAYVHVAGGELRDGVARDTHSEPIPSATLRLLEHAVSRGSVPAVILERDFNTLDAAGLQGEIDNIREAVARGLASRAEASRAEEGARHARSA
jgi:uncharacterized protein